MTIPRRTVYVDQPWGIAPQQVSRQQEGSYEKVGRIDGGRIDAGGRVPGPTRSATRPPTASQEREQLVARNWDLEGKQTQDDIDMMLMLRPAGQLTIWNVQ